MFKYSAKFLLIMLLYLQSGSAYAQRLQISMNRLFCRDLSEKTDEIVVRLTIGKKFESDYFTTERSFDFKKVGDNFSDILLLDTIPPKNGRWEIGISLLERDFNILWRSSEGVVGSYEIMVDFGNNTLTTTWSFSQEVHAIYPFVLGKHSYGCKMFGQDAFYESLVLIKDY